MDIGAVEEGPGPALLLCRQRNGSGSRLGIQHPAPNPGQYSAGPAQGETPAARWPDLVGELSKRRPSAGTWSPLRWTSPNVSRRR